MTLSLKPALNKKHITGATRQYIYPLLHSTPSRDGLAWYSQQQTHVNRVILIIFINIIKDDTGSRVLSAQIDWSRSVVGSKYTLIQSMTARIVEGL